jgi:hypothetical protein
MPLAQVQHVGAHGAGDVGPVVDRQQRAVLVTAAPQHLQEGHLLPCLQALLPELDDIHPGAEHGVEEVRQVPLALPGVGALVQPRGRQPRTQIACHRPEFVIFRLCMRSGQNVP